MRSKVNGTAVLAKVIRDPGPFYFVALAFPSRPKLVHPYYTYIPTMGSGGKHFRLHSHLIGKN